LSITVAYISITRLTFRHHAQFLSLLIWQKKVDSTEEDYVPVEDIAGEKRVASSHIQKQKTLVTGRFAVVHSGTVAVGSESKPVAIKSLKRTYKTTR